MTTSDPDQIRRQIETTRQELSADVDALTEKVTPSRIVGRRVDRAKDTMSTVKDKIMGTADSATSTMGDTASGVTGRVSSAASSTAEAVSEAPRAVRRQARGNPMAAGLVAFGLGWLISSLLPSSRKEQELASQATQAMGEQLQPVAQQVRQAASQVADNMREPAQQAVESVKATASDAASTVADEGRAAKDQVASRAEDAKDTVRHQSGS